VTGKEKLLQAAFELFSERGFAAVGIREIGDRAGLTNPAIYQHFKGKGELGLQVYLIHYARLIDAIDRRLHEDLSAIERIEAYTEAATELHRQKPSPLLFLEDEQRQFGAQMKAVFGKRSIVPRLTGWIEQGQSEGEIRTDIPVPIMVALTIGQITKWAAMSSLRLAPTRNAAKFLKVQLRAVLSTPTPISKDQPMPASQRFTA